MTKLVIGSGAGDKAAQISLTTVLKSTHITTSTAAAWRAINAVTGAGTFLSRPQGAGIRWAEFYLVTVATSTTTPRVGAGSPIGAAWGVSSTPTITNFIGLQPSGTAWQAYSNGATAGATFGSYTPSTAGTVYTIGIVVDLNSMKARVWVDSSAAPGPVANPSELDLSAYTGTNWNLFGYSAIIGETIEVNAGFDVNGAYRPATNLATYLAAYPTAIPWQDDKFHAVRSPVISPRPVAHIRL